MSDENIDINQDINDEKQASGQKNESLSFFNKIRELLKNNKTIRILFYIFCIFILLFCYLSINTTIKINNEYKQALILYDKAQLTQTVDDFNNAYFQFKKLHEKYPNYKNINKYFLFLNYVYEYNLGIQFLKEQKYNDAKINFEKALANNYSVFADNKYNIQALISLCDINILVNKASQALKEKKYFDAIKYYEEALKQDISYLEKCNTDIEQKEFQRKFNQESKALIEKGIKQIKIDINKYVDRYIEISKLVNIEHDNIENRTHIFDKSISNTILQNGISLELLMQENWDKPELLLVIYHIDSDFSYFNKVVINCDGEKIEIDIPEEDVIRKRVPELIYLIGVDAVKEHVLIFNNRVKNLLEIVNKIINSKNTYIRLKGEAKYYDREVTPEEKNSLQLMRDYYWYMNNPEFTKRQEL